MSLLVLFCQPDCLYPKAQLKCSPLFTKFIVLVHLILLHHEQTNGICLHGLYAYLNDQAFQRYGLEVKNINYGYRQT